MSLTLKKKCKISKRKLLKNLKDNDFLFTMIKAPSEDLILNLLKINPKIIQYIKKPTEKICIMAVRQNIYCLKLIKNPSVLVCYEACKKLKEGFPQCLKDPLPTN